MKIYNFIIYFLFPICCIPICIALQSKNLPSCQGEMKDSIQQEEKYRMDHHGDGEWADKRDDVNLPIAGHSETKEFKGTHIQVDLSNSEITDNISCADLYLACLEENANRTHQTQQPHPVTSANNRLEDSVKTEPAAGSAEIVTHLKEEETSKNLSLKQLPLVTRSNISSKDSKKIDPAAETAQIVIDLNAEENSEQQPHLIKNTHDTSKHSGKTDPLAETAQIYTDMNDNYSSEDSEKNDTILEREKIVTDLKDQENATDLYPKENNVFTCANNNSKDSENSGIAADCGKIVTDLKDQENATDPRLKQHNPVTNTNNSSKDSEKTDAATERAKRTRDLNGQENTARGDELKLISDRHLNYITNVTEYLLTSTKGLVSLLYEMHKKVFFSAYRSVPYLRAILVKDDSLQWQKSHIAVLQFAISFVGVTALLKIISCIRSAMSWSPKVDTKQGQQTE